MTAAPLRILLVEDDPDDVMIFRHLLAGWGIAADITVAGCVCEAVTHRGAEIAVVDFNLPHMSGATAINALERMGVRACLYSTCCRNHLPTAHARAARHFPYFQKGVDDAELLAWIKEGGDA